uniref:Sulfotransferase n=1 Tax=Paramormyrops kingsleyae TaxID=1676925 RepID=A0A3B3S294_9TELE
MEPVAPYLCRYKGYVFGMPWLEYPDGRPDYVSRPSPRLFASHLTPALMPRGLREKGIVYVMRNPKDNVISYFHFCHVWNQLETPQSFKDFLEHYLTFAHKKITVVKSLMNGFPIVGSITARVGRAKARQHKINVIEELCSLRKLRHRPQAMPSNSLGYSNNMHTAGHSDMYDRNMGHRVCDGVHVAGVFAL